MELYNKTILSIPARQPIIFASRNEAFRFLNTPDFEDYYSTGIIKIESNLYINNTSANMRYKIFHNNKVMLLKDFVLLYEHAKQNLEAVYMITTGNLMVQKGCDLPTAILDETFPSLMEQNVLQTSKEFISYFLEDKILKAEKIKKSKAEILLEQEDSEEDHDSEEESESEIESEENESEEDWDSEDDTLKRK